MAEVVVVIFTVTNGIYTVGIPNQMDLFYIHFWLIITVTIILFYAFEISLLFKEAILLLVMGVNLFVNYSTERINDNRKLSFF